MRRARTLAVVALLSALAAAYGQETEAEEGVLDELFNEPAADTVVQDSGIDYRTAVVVDDKVKISGQFYAVGGAAAGYVSWPTGDDLTEGFDKSLGAYAKTTLAVDAKPSSVARVYGSFIATFSPFSSSAFSWNQFAIDDLYCDYTAMDAMFVRLGRFDTTWGQGRLFTPGNLMSGSGSSFSLRTSFPTLLDGVSLYALGMGAVIEDYLDLTYAAKADWVVLGTYLSGAVRYVPVSEDFRGLVSVKKVVLGTDLLADATVRRYADAYTFSGLAGFFREWGDVKLYGEYTLASTSSAVTDQRLAIALGLNNVFGTPIDVGVKWYQSLSDWSGYVLAAATWTPFKYLTVAVGLPYVYGRPGTYYIVNSYLDENDDEQAQGLYGYRAAVVFTATLKVSF